MPGKKVVEKVEAKQKLAALLLADSFTQKFRPITVERPKVLLPLVNAPLLEYSLEWLALNKVEEVFVFCCAHADQVKKHLTDSKWSKQKHPHITTITYTNCLNMGEALRHVDKQDYIKTDFILVSGDTVSNMRLEPVLAAHRARREKDKNAIMTMVLKSAADPVQRLRLGESQLLVEVDPATQQLLKLQELGGHRPGGARRQQRCSVDASFFGERDALQVRTDLIDCNISICAPEVLMLFSDNFDYQNLRKDFVGGTLSEEELGNKIHIYELQGEYAARVNTFRSYDAVSRDLVQRWAFPFVPDTNAFHKAGSWGPSSYRYQRGHRYLESGVTLARSASLGFNVVVGAGTSVGEGTSISHTVIGRNCRIGKNCKLQGCYLQDNVVLQDNVTATYALLCERVVVKSGATVSKGNLLSYGVVVGARHTVPENSHISLCRQIQSQVNDSDDELEYSATGRHSSGSGRPGRSRRSSSSSSDSESSDDSDHSSSSFGGLMGCSLERPDPNAIAAAEALAANKEPGEGVSFTVGLVGLQGAGYAWSTGTDKEVLMQSIAPPPMRLEEHTFDSDAEDEVAGPSGTGPTASGTSGRNGAADSDDDGEGRGAGGGGARDPESIFKQEVGETFLRCLKLRFDQTNVVIELNSLKIAEDRTFADLARYLFTTLLALCLPPPSWCSSEYRILFPTSAPDATTLQGKLGLLKSFQGRLEEWKGLLQRFLKDEDDQVELLLTLEEYCSDEGVFEGSGESGAPFAAVFPKILESLYHADVVSEEAFLAWAEEKEHAEADERVYLDQAAKFLEWLREADDEEEESEEDSD